MGETMGDLVVRLTPKLKGLAFKALRICGHVSSNAEMALGAERVDRTWLRDLAQEAVVALLRECEPGHTDAYYCSRAYSRMIDEIKAFSTHVVNGKRIRRAKHLDVERWSREPARVKGLGLHDLLDMREAVQNMEPVDKIIATLKMEGYSLSEIGEEVGLTGQAVGLRIKKMRRYFQKPF